MADVENVESTNEEIEMEEIEGGDQEEAEGDEETNLNDNENLEWDDSILVPQGFNPDLGDIPDDARGLKRIFSRDKKIFLKNAYGCELEQR